MANPTTPKTTGATPGPWRALPSGRVVSDAYPNTDPRHYLAQVYDGETCGEVNAADSHLIAAAPAMRDELEKTLTALRCAYLAAKGNLSAKDRYEAMAVVEEAIKSHGAALAQARGEK